MNKNKLKFTVQDARKALGDFKGDRLINVLHSNTKRLKVKHKVVYVPCINKYGKESEVRQTLNVYDVDEAINLYHFKVKQKQGISQNFVNVYKRMIKELRIVKEYLEKEKVSNS